MKKTCWWFLFLLLVNFYRVVPAIAADVFSHYRINATLDTSGKMLTGYQKVTLVNTSGNAISEVYFYIYPNREYSPQEKRFMLRYGGYFKVNPFPAGYQKPDYEIANVKAGGQAAAFSIEGEDKTLLKINLAKPLSPDESIEMEMNFSAKIPHAYGRFGWHDDIFALARWYPLLAVLDEQGWQLNPYYPFHRPFFSEAAHYDVTLTVPQQVTVIHSGLEKSVTSVGGEAKEIVMSSEQPIREFTLAASSRYQVKESQGEEVKLKAYYLPGDERHAQLALDNARGMMAYYVELFGGYPYREFSIAPVHLGYGGEQMPNLIFIDARAFRLPGILDRYFDFLISHETGHQWFYNLVGVDAFTEMWLEEGVNSYFLLQYLEKKYGKNEGIIDWPKKMEWLLPNFSFRSARATRYHLIARTNLDRPISGKLSSFQEPSSIFSLTYGKGAGITDMLRYLLGDEAFFNVFKRLFKEYQFKNVTRADLLRLCNEEMKQDYTWFFDQWLDTNKKADFAVAGVRDNEIFLVNKGGVEMPRDLKVTFKDGKQKTMRVERWNEKSEALEMESFYGGIKEVVLDPDERILDIDRTNNVWPRRVNKQIVPLYLPVYEIPVFIPEDAYSWITGPELANGGLGVKSSFQKPYDWNLYGAVDYEFGESLTHSRAGFLWKNLFKTQTAAGVELFHVTDNDGGEEDLAGGKLFLRRELWPAAYGLGDINDHVTLYLLRDRSLSGDLTGGGLEDSRNVSYLKKDEAIVGTALHLSNNGPYPDPVEGYQLDALLESSGHFLGATQYFYRSSLDGSHYQPVTPRTRLAFRGKYGWGFPDDKNLYELGGMNGLRGFDRKTIRGANIWLGSVEYRFPIIEDIKVGRRFGVSHWLDLESISGVAFFDGGTAWREDYEDAKFRRDAGFGLRAKVNVGSLLENALLRLDVAEAIGDGERDPHVWFGVNQAF